MPNFLDSIQRSSAIADARLMIRILSDDKKLMEAAEVLAAHDIEFNSDRVAELTNRSIEVYEGLKLSRHSLRYTLDEERMRTNERQQHQRVGKLCREYQDER
jgi:hypothetical protein|tara:strand:+ start:991 stop:1296 length:306 start_codon:yes stop_codon:yes gene_type:complete